MPRAKSPSRPRSKTTKAEANESGLGVRFAMIIFIAGALFLIGALVWRREFAQSPDLKSPEAKEIPKATPAPSSTPSPTQSPARVYTEPGPASLVTSAPDGWAAGEVDGIIAKVGPVSSTDGHKTAFMVHAYQYLPLMKPGGVYVIEPGMDANGSGRTIPDVIDQLTSKVNDTRDALDGLESSIIELKKRSDASGKNN